jgi:hypothetical protein
MLRAASFSCAVAVTAISANAGEKPVEIGEVSSRVARAGVDYPLMVRRVSEDEVRGLDLSRVPVGKRVIVSVALVRMDTLDEPEKSATCVVNATIRDAKRGAMLAILEGKAKASGETSTVEKNALQGALHGALAHIPEVLRH